jgi:hypothetical protein
MPEPASLYTYTAVGAGVGGSGYEGEWESTVGEDDGGVLGSELGGVDGCTLG